MASVMQVHVPENNNLHKHFAFVGMEVLLTKVGKLPYDGRVIGCEFQRTISAGLYGFINKETRNHFVSTLNGAAEIEVCFIAQIQPATASVANNGEDTNG